MRVEIEVLAYNRQKGLRLEWEPGFTIEATIQNGSVVITANEPGLKSLARHLLTLAQPEVPSGHHIHLDESNALEQKSCEIILAKG